MQTRHILARLGALALLACIPPHAHADAIADLRQAWCDDLKLKNIDASMRLYADDAVFFNPGGDHVDGKAAIRALFAGMTQAFDSDIRLLSRSTAISGPLAYDSGEFQETMTRRADGRSQPLNGSYLMVLRRGKDGHWRIIQQMWTGAPPQP
jgi:uncharacterized protein (TIGR02246 family)